MSLTRWELLLSFCKKGCKSGLLAGSLWGLLFLFFTSPLIWEAEVYEEKGNHHHIQETLHSRSHDEGRFDLPENLKRQLVPTVIGCTLLGGAFGSIVSVFLGMGFSFGFLTRNFFESPIRSAIPTGLICFLVFHGIPSFFNPPELPGVIGSEDSFTSRQYLWIQSVACSVVGVLVYLVLSSGESGRIVKIFGSLLGILIALLPLLSGTSPETISSPVPMELRSRFIYYSLTINFIFWLSLTIQIFLRSAKDKTIDTYRIRNEEIVIQ
ncbi:putative cobalt transporter subunit CbtA [Leptospira inadai serovar Lyme str. 10]|uniref:Cobalt transporter n=2 Tax=Leptospira inadai serovar Lyme TaxID=293084 RepID=A0ABX4YD33_9LEPT|nr:CbtA family protein [Leptospira inadai]EQA34753.1 putative cobalt transporter subunit CbtA [Leptospira inadai serovar Lyme str. 10]PNV71943.1 cobalt transporter [Leptospira inadai serovar Lyme]